MRQKVSFRRLIAAVVTVLAATSLGWAASANAQLPTGNVLVLNGPTDRGLLLDNSSIDLGDGATEDFTIESFIYVPDESSDAVQDVISKQNAYSLFINFNNSSSDVVLFRFWFGPLSSQFSTLFNTANITAGWHHVAAVFDNEWSASNDRAAIYLDGVEFASTTAFEYSPGVFNSTNALFIGGPGSFDGKLEETRLSSDVRYSSAYTVPSSPFMTDLTTSALWHFDDACGSTSFADSSGNSNTLTGENGAHTDLPGVPDAPTLTDTDPDSPANDNDPEVKGTVSSCGSPADVKIYKNATCSGSADATGTVAAFTGAGISVSVGDDTTSDLSARATNADGDSACSNSIAYTEDSTGPDPPAITDSDPDSPANDNSPEFKGTVGAGSPVQVNLYKNGTCSGSADASGTVAEFTGAGITVSVGDDATTTVSARTVDAAGNESTCSGTFSYTEDSTAPDPPSITDSDPDSPANDNSPELKGTVGAGSPTQVLVYKNGACSGSPDATGTVAEFTGAGITVSASDDATTTMSARTVDAAGNESSCSGTFSYTEDSTAPDPPSITDSDPGSPANDNSPELKGTVGGGSPTQVKLYKNASCSGSPDATGTVAEFTGAGITVSVGDDTSTTLSARTTDAVGNESSCSGTFSYTEDSTAPDPPSITDSDPDPPANDNSPELKGTVGGGSPVQVKLYKNASCSGSPDGTGTVAEFTGAGTTVAVSDDATTTLSARTVDAAGNESSCSGTFSYTEDSTAPDPPSITDSDPDSPANDNNPELKGTVGGGSPTQVKLYKNASCSGSPDATGTVAEFTGAGITVAVGDDATTTVSARTADAAGNESTCSGTFPYTEDSTAPAAPNLTDTDPDSPSSDNSPRVKGNAEAGSTVRLYTSADCTGTVAATGDASDLAAPGLLVTVGSDSTTAFRSTATDAVGNVSACSPPITYTEDSTAPDPPSITDSDPDSPANDNSPELKGTVGAASPTQVKLYKNGTCSGSPDATGTVAEFTGTGITVSVSDDATTTLSARTVDAANNESSCSGTFTYTEDSTAPDAPSITDSDPDSPANDNNPEFKGTVGGGSPVQVKLYKNGTCTGTPDATGTVAEFTGAGITVAVGGDATTTLSARTADAANNESSCSGTFTYTEDSTAPDPPSITDSDPDSPANDNSPEFKGTVGAGSPTQVKLYKNGTCTGTPDATGTVAEYTGAGITVSVSDDATTTVSARTADAAGNESTCSGTFSYTEDSTAPAAPDLTDTDPDSPANNNSPSIKGNAEAGSTVRLYTTAGCTGSEAGSGTAGALASPGLSVTVADGSTTAYRATATDAAGNASGCSGPITYVEDSTAPETTIDSGPTDPTDDSTPTFTFSSPDAGASFECAIDSGGFSPCTSPFTTAELTAVTHTFRVRARDSAGNPDGSPASRVFTVSTPQTPGGGEQPAGGGEQQPAGGGAGGTPTAPSGEQPGTTGPKGPTNGDDNLVGTPGPDTICGLLGNDVIDGLAGNDTIFGDACKATARVSAAATGGNDRLIGGAGNDKLYGASGNDTLAGAAGNDTLDGGPGRDSLDGGAGNDKLKGGPGPDKLNGGLGNDSVNAVNRKKDTVDCGKGRDTAKVDRADRVRGCEKVKRGKR